MRAIIPAAIFDFVNPSEVAECWEGVYHGALYNSLWSSMEGAKPISAHIDIENSAPGDAIGINTVSFFWGKYSDAEKLQLNELAEKQR